MGQNVFTKPGWYFYNGNVVPTIGINGKQVLTPNFQDSATAQFFLNPDTGNVQLSGLGAPGTPGAAGPAGSISATSGPSPWIDAAAYGAKARSSILQTTATTSAGTPNITLVNARDFVNGDGLVIWKAGAATTQSTPAAPTVAAWGVQGTKTTQYQCVGVDEMGGLTAASPIGSVINAPNAFGNKAVTISSISRSGGVVTVNFSTNINAGSGQQIVIVNVTGDTSFNGVWAVASAPSSSQVTYNSTGSNGSGTVGASTTGRLLNSFNITAISRVGNIVTVTTNANHTFVAGTGQRPTIVTIQFVNPPEFNGQWVIATASGNQFTFQMGNAGALTGTVVTQGPAASTATVYEYNLVTCPVLSGTTVGYYIYGDDGTGTIALIGKTLRAQRTFMDWGPFLRNSTTLGFNPPAYVPTTPPIAAQNQLYVGVIGSGGGTTSLVMTTNVPSTVAGQAALHDEGQAIQAAVTAAANGTSPSKGGVLISPSTVSGGFYVINSPIIIPTFVNIEIGAQLVVNETISLTGFNSLCASPTASGMNGIQFDHQNFVLITGYANPIINAHISCMLEGLNFDGGVFGNDIDGQNNVLFNGAEAGYGGVQADFAQITNCCFGAGTATTSVPLVFQGITSSVWMHAVTLDASWPLSATGSLPTNLAPPIGAIWFKGDDNAGVAAGLAHVLMDGENSIAGRGILIDGSLSSVGYIGQNWTFSDIWDQQPVTPGLMIFGTPGGGGPTNVVFRNWLGDSSAAPAYGNWGATNGLLLRGCTVSGSISLLNGFPVANLRSEKIVAGTPLGQNTDYSDISWGYFNSGNVGGQETGGVESIAKPVILKTNRVQPLAVQIQPVTSLTATQSASIGTIPAGTYSFAITVVGFNGGENIHCGTVDVTLDGSHGVDLSWDATVGAKGYNVYWDKHDTNGLGWYGTTLAATSHTYTSIPSYSGSVSDSDGTGLPLIDKNQVATPLLRLPNGLFKADISAATLTANRDIKVADAPGTLMVETSLGIGNGTPGTAITTTPKNTGTGPTTPQTVVKYAQFTASDGQVYYVPLMQ